MGLRTHNLVIKVGDRQTIETTNNSRGSSFEKPHPRDTALGLIELLHVSSLLETSCEKKT
jgi:hypothetical protein